MCGCISVFMHLYDIIIIKHIGIKMINTMTLGNIFYYLYDLIFYLISK
jgi:hypothetical protein